MKQEIIRVEDFSYIYEDTDVKVLQDLNFTINSGDFVGIIGANKAGKSTLCQALVGVLPYVLGGKWSGEIYLNGKALSSTKGIADAGLIGIVLQDAESQFTQETVADEIAFAMCNFGYPRELMVERVQMAAEVCGLSDLLERSPFRLSGGQQQRLAVACVFALLPQIIILDETTSQLDPLGRDEVFTLITQLHEQGSTIIMVDHNIEKIAEYSDKLLVLHEGKCRLFGTKQEVLEQSDVLRACGLRLPQVTQAALDLGWTADCGKLPTDLESAEQYFASLKKEQEAGIHA